MATPRKPKQSRQKITDEIIAGLARLISSGVPYETAADSVRIGECTLYKWLRKGRKSTRKGCPYGKLVQELKKAHADAITRNVAIVQKAAGKTWQAAAWWLERREPDKFGSDRHELNRLKKELAEIVRRLEAHNGPNHPVPTIGQTVPSPVVETAASKAGDPLIHNGNKPITEQPQPTKPTS